MLSYGVRHLYFHFSNVVYFAAQVGLFIPSEYISKVFAISFSFLFSFFLVCYFL